MSDSERSFLLEWAQRLRDAGDPKVGDFLDRADFPALRFHVLTVLFIAEKQSPRGEEGVSLIDHPGGRGVAGALVECLVDELAKHAEPDEAQAMRSMPFKAKYDRVKHLMAVNIPDKRPTFH